MRSIGKVLFPVIWTSLSLLLLELACGFWVTRYGDALDRTRSVMIADSFLGWRQRPNLNTEFLGMPLQTNELGWRSAPLAGLQHHPQVLVLGPSSAFGWGVAQNEPYAAQLQLLLPNMAVINAGEIGYSTFQGLRMLNSPEGKSLRPRHIIVAYGVNDVDRHRFYFQSSRSDADELSRPRSGIEVQSFRGFARSSLLSVLYKIANRIRAFSSHAAGAPESPTPGVRVDRKEFAANLREFAAAGKALHAKVTFLSTPLNRPPLRALTGENQRKIERLWGEARNHYGRNKLELALASLQQLTAIDPDCNEAYYLMNNIALALGDAPAAKKYNDKARATEPVRIHRDVIAYNAIIQRVAAEENIPYIDLNGLLSGKNQSAHFVDSIHPSADGHREIAREIFQRLFQEKK